MICIDFEEIPAQWTIRKKRAQVTSTILILAPVFDSSISLMVQQNGDRMR